MRIQSICQKHKTTSTGHLLHKFNEPLPVGCGLWAVGSSLS